jgi:hypothetical protein
MPEIMILSPSKPAARVAGRQTRARKLAVRSGPPLERVNTKPSGSIDRQVRAAEAVDPEGRQWPRTKRSDDATAVYLDLGRRE